MAEFWVLVLAGALSLAAPLVIAGVGEVILERSGAGFNLGIEGMLLVGALVAVLGSKLAGPWAGAACAAAAGLLFGLLYALGARAGIDTVLVGIVLAIGGAGISTFLFQRITPTGRTNVSAPTLPTITVPGLADVPLLGRLFTGTGVGVYLAVGVAVAAAVVLRGTRFGLRLRAAGDDPEVARVRGIRVGRYRLAAALIAGSLAGLAGAVMSLAAIGSFTPLMSAGKGFIALAVVIIARRSPLGVLAGALLFAVFDSLALLAQTRDLALPVEAYQALPYVATLAVLCVQSARTTRRAQRLPAETETP